MFINPLKADHEDTHREALEYYQILRMHAGLYVILEYYVNLVRSASLR